MASGWNMNSARMRCRPVRRPPDLLQRREVLFNSTNSQEQAGKTTFFVLKVSQWQSGVDFLKVVS
jgi:hypothetical protein